MCADTLGYLLSPSWMMRLREEGGVAFWWGSLSPIPALLVHAAKMSISASLSCGRADLASPVKYTLSQGLFVPAAPPPLCWPLGGQHLCVVLTPWPAVICLVEREGNWCPGGRCGYGVVHVLLYP